MTRSRPGPTACFIRFDYPPAFHEFDRGDRSAPGFSRHPRTVGVALSVAQPVVNTAAEADVRQLGSAAKRERHDMVNLQPVAGAAAASAVAVDIAATALVAAPHFPSHAYRDVP